MCGIVGYITTGPEVYEKARRGFMKYALMLDTLRGPDSTGVISVSKKFTVNRFKTLAPGFRFATSRQFDDLVPNGWAMIGHNRAATVGAVELDNAHPFKFGKVSLVHNGTLDTKGSSLPTFDKNLAVDSMQIAKALNSVPPKEAKEMLEYLKGDFAIVWIDERDRSINMARNSARPLHLAYNYDRTLLLFMSDDNHLEVLSKAFKNTAAYTPTIYSLDTFQHLKWKNRGSLRPEVTQFRPFQVALTARTPSPSQQKQVGMVGTPSRTGETNNTNMSRTRSPDIRKTAEERANERWRRAIKGDNGIIPERVSGRTRFRINQNVAGIHQAPTTIGPAHLACMERFWNLTPDDLCSFKLDNMYDLDDRLVRCTGTAIIPTWQDSEWDCTINFVRKHQADAWQHRPWLVRPIGVTHSENIPGCPALLADLIHCDYESYAGKMREQETVQDDEPFTIDNETGNLVADPDGKLIAREQLQAKFDDGCIECGGQLYLTLSHTYVTVNEGRDTLCEQCKWKSAMEDS